MIALWHNEILQDGFATIREVFTSDEAASISAELSIALCEADDENGAIRSQNGIVYAARNVLKLFPKAHDVWRREPLLHVLQTILGSGAGLVRVLYFDKPPEQSWSLPWHKDLTIAVERNDLPSAQFRHPTYKASVSHVEAPRSLLEQMLTLRIHLDAATEQNGPLQVIPGSHHDDTNSGAVERPSLAVLAERGDVLAMRPLLSHCSGGSAPGTTQHRRILHLEFAATPTLPDGYAWHTFVPAFASTARTAVPS
jgi:hypothetical protein